MPFVCGEVLLLAGIPFLFHIPCTGRVGNVPGDEADLCECSEESVEQIYNTEVSQFLPERAQEY